MSKLITASYKQRKFVHSYLRTGNKKQAALEAYETTPKNASQVAAATLAKPTTLEYMKRIMDTAGMTDDAVANGLKAITEAGLSANSLKQATPAHALKALEMTSKLKDLFPAEKKKIEKSTLSVKLEGLSMEELQAKLNKLSDEARSFSKLLSKDVIEGEVINENMPKL